MKYKRLKLYLLFLTSFLFIDSLPAQIIEWSNTQKLRGNSLYTTILGEDNSGIYILRHRNKLLSKFVVIERYRHNLGLEISKSILLKDTRILFTEFNESNIILIKQVFDKKISQYKIVANVYNNSLEQINDEKILQYSNHNHAANIDFRVMIKPSPNHKNYFILLAGNTQLSTNFNKFIIIDQNINTIDSGHFIFNSDWNIASIEDFTINHDLNFSLLLKSKKNKSGIHNYGIYENKKFKPLLDSNAQFDNLMLFYNPITQTKCISGYYTTAIENGYEGNFYIKWKNLWYDSIKILKDPFSKSILKSLTGEVKFQTGFLPNSYKPLKCIGRNDGGFVKISENSFVQKEQDISIVNGIPSSQGKNLYIFENVLIQNYDSIGHLSWESSLLKNQSTINDGGLLGSVFISVTSQFINILYNDPITIGGDIVLTDFSLDGSRQNKIIAKGDEMNAFIIPTEGRQISPYKMMVPVLKDRKFALLKLTFK